jgi:hypothetical protein
MRPVFIVVTALIFLCVPLLATVFGERVTLVADEDLNLYSTSSGGKVIKKLNSGGSAKVMACLDLKSYIVPQLRVENETVFVLEGQFHLVRASVWDFKAGPISFTC